MKASRERGLFRSGIGGMLFLSCFLSRALAQSEVYVGHDYTLTGAWYPDYYIVVGYSDELDFLRRTNGTSPTLTITGAFFPAQSGVAAYNGSVVNANSFTTDISFGLSANDSSTINVGSGNTFSNGSATGNGTFNMGNSAIIFSLNLFDSSSANLQTSTIGSEHLVDPTYPNINVTANNGSRASLTLPLSMAV